MICVDTNIFVNFFRGTKDNSTDILQRSLDEQRLLMSPFVLSELLSSPKLSKGMEKHLLALPRIEIEEGFFERAGYLRRVAYQKGKGIAIADIYIAQSCIDSGVDLLTLDQDLVMLANLSTLRVVGMH